jgi:hypothetical protein
MKKSIFQVKQASSGVRIKKSSSCLHVPEALREARFRLGNRFLSKLGCLVSALCFRMARDAITGNMMLFGW